MAVAQETDGSRRANFELSDRSAASFLRLYARLPEAEQYCNDRYARYVRGGSARLPSSRQGRPGELECGAVFVAVEQSEPAGAADEGLRHSIEMPVYSVTPVCWRMGTESSILVSAR